MIKFQPNLLHIAFASLMLSLSACSDNMDIDNANILDSNGTVTISVALPTAELNTRDAASVIPTISNGSQIDKLVFALYKKKPDSNSNEDEYEIVPLTDSEDQLTKKVSSDSWPVTFKLALDASATYRAAFWAQSSKCDAYDTSDLKKVAVSYENAKNNDETRDAFTAFADITFSSKPQEIILHRPFAQINIGTTGADYTNLIYNPAIKPKGVIITESKIKVSGLANRFNAVTGEATEAMQFDPGFDPESGEIPLIEETFDWAPLPAWYVSGVPIYKSVYDNYVEDNSKDSSKKLWEENPFIKFSYVEGSEVFKGPEQFLYVNLNNPTQSNASLADYVTRYPTINPPDAALGTPKYRTETFKYLSMCYVLVPSSDDLTLDNNDKVKGSTVIVKYNLRKNIPNDLNDPNIIELNERTIHNVPVSPNMRTNLLGGFSLTDEDITSIFNTVDMGAIIMRHFSPNYFVGGVTYGEEDKGE